MQPDLKSTQKVSPHHQYQSQHGILPVDRGYRLQVAELVGEDTDDYSPADLNNLARITEVLSREQQQAQKTRGPSPTIWRFVLMLGDAVLLITLLSLALVPHFNLGIRIWNDELGTWDSKFVWGCQGLILWGIAASIMRAQEMDNISNRFKSPLNALFALILTFVVWTLLMYPVAKDKLAYTSSLVFFLVLATPTMSIWRVALAGMINLPRFRRKAVIVGVSAAGETIVRELCNAKRPGIHVLGCISERTGEYLEKDSLPILGGRTTLRYLAWSGAIDMIIIAVDYRESYELFQEAINLAQLGISVVPMAVVYESVCGRIPVEHIGDQWYIALPSTDTIPPFYLCFHKAVDIIFALFGSMVLLLILPILALLICLDSPGSIFYTQERLGYQGKKFSIIKFRSMRTDAEYLGHAKWATKEDMRVTRVGRFLRSTHLDELPQVFNILRGDMSLIGPRPERQEFVSKLEESIPFYRCRLSVTPGLTGWAQVKYSYGSTDQDALAKLQYDLYYIKHRSITLNIFIVLKTVAEVLLRRGR